MKLRANAVMFLVQILVFWTRDDKWGNFDENDGNYGKPNWSILEQEMKNEVKKSSLNIVLISI